MSKVSEIEENLNNLLSDENLNRFSSEELTELQKILEDFISDGMKLQKKEV